MTRPLGRALPVLGRSVPTVQRVADVLLALLVEPQLRARPRRAGVAPRALRRICHQTPPTAVLTRSWREALQIARCVSAFFCARACVEGP